MVRGSIPDHSRREQGPAQSLSLILLSLTSFSNCDPIKEYQLLHWKQNMKGNHYIYVLKINLRYFFFFKIQYIMHLTLQILPIRHFKRWLTQNILFPRGMKRFLVDVFHYFPHKNKSDIFSSIYAFKHVSCFCACMCV